MGGLQQISSWSEALLRRCTWPGAALEGLDDDQFTTAARTWLHVTGWLIVVCVGFGVILKCRHIEQLSCPCNIGHTIAVGEQAIMPDAMEA